MRGMEICPEMHALAKMAEMAINRQNRQTVKKLKFKIQRGPFESGDFGENGVFGENGDSSPKYLMYLRTIAE